MFNKIDLYVIKKLAKTLLFITMAIMLIIIVFDYSEKVNKFIKHDISFFGAIINYYIYKVVFFAYMILPIFTFISVIYVTSRLTIRNEIIAILCCGINYYRLLLTYFAFAMCIGLISYIFGNTIVPISNKSMIEFECKYLTRCNLTSSRNIHKQYEQGKYLYINWFDFNNNEGRGITLEHFKKGKLINKTFAQKVVLDSNNVWNLYNYFQRDYKNNAVNKGNFKDTIISIKPEELKTSEEEAPTFNYKELDERIEKEKIKGDSAIVYLKIEKYTRILSPVLTILLTILGFSVSGKKKRGGVGSNIAIGTALAFSFVFMHRIATVMSTKAGADPFISLSSLFVVFGIITFIAVFKAQK